jgi:hypothetical protein
MVGDPDPTKARRMKMGHLALEPCPKSYQCEDCEIDQKFLEEMQDVVERVRAIP